MKWILLVVFTGFIMVDNPLLHLTSYAQPFLSKKDNLAEQTDNVLKIVIKEKPSIETLPKRTNNWMSVQGEDDWEGLAEDQLHKRQLTFDTPEQGIRAGAISLITRALRKNNKPEVSISQIFFDEDGWAEDRESYRLDTISKGFSDTDTIDVMNKDQMKKLINFISNHEMGVENYEAITDKNEVINRGLNMAYDYVLSNEYSLRDLING
jgi:hypothetical protein